MRKRRTKKTTIMRIITLEWFSKWGKLTNNKQRNLALVEYHKRLLSKVDQIQMKNQVVKERYNHSLRIILKIIRYLHKYLPSYQLRNHW